jgi:hypothetical protein
MRVTIIAIICFLFLAFHCKKETNSESQTNTVNSESKLDTQTTNSDNKTYKYVIAKSGLKLREATDTKSKVLTTIPFNTQVEVIGEQEGEEVTKGKPTTWFQVTYEGMEGFAYGGFLSDMPDFPVLPEQFESVNFKTTYDKGLQNTKILIHSDKTVTGEVTEYNGCDYIIESGKWSANDSEKYIKLSTKGYIDEMSCLEPADDPISNIYILKMNRTCDGSQGWTCNQGKFNEKYAVICDMDK